MASGIYSIRNKANGKLYVGSTVDFASRWANHRCQLRKGNHDNSYLQRAWVKYGEDAFEFAVLVECPEGDLAVTEARFIHETHAGTREHGYNLDTFIQGRRAVSPETRAKLSAACKGRKLSDETKAKLSAAKMGRKHSLEARAAMSLAQTGRKHSEETLQKFREHRHTDETRAKIAAAHTGLPMTDDAKEKLRQANLGRTASAETKEKLRAAFTGRYVSDETKVRMREAWVLRKAKRTPALGPVPTC